MPRFRFVDDPDDDLPDHIDRRVDGRFDSHRPIPRSRRPRAGADHAPPASDPHLPDGARRSTYQESRSNQGPRPVPTWLVTSAAALDYERGTLKTGKEADVDLVERVDPETGDRCLLAAKRYRAAEHRLFHRDADYLEGRRLKDSREQRAAANRTAFGKQVIATQWANAEFEALSQLWLAGIAVPYPAQLNGTELLVEFIGDDDGFAAPRLAETRPDRTLLASLWEQLRAAMLALAVHGWAHGDLSPYNLLVADDRLVLIDLPQIVDVNINPRGTAFLRRDLDNVSDWFIAHGGVDDIARDQLWQELLVRANLS